MPKPPALTEAQYDAAKAALAAFFQSRKFHVGILDGEDVLVLRFEKDAKFGPEMALAIDAVNAIDGALEPEPD